MKKIHFTSTLFLVLSVSGQICFAQYGQNNAKLNSNINLNRYNPTAETIFTADTTINHVDFGKKDNKRSFAILFPFKRIRDNNKSNFDFKMSQITETRMSRYSLVTQIELTNQGFELTYTPGNEFGPVDDYVAIRTETGDVILRLTGEIVDSKRKESD